MDLDKYLVGALIEVGKSAGNNATLAVMLRPSGDGEGLPGACLAVGEYRPIVASQHTVQITKLTITNTHTVTLRNV